jgi:hypothetical protein
LLWFLDIPNGVHGVLELNDDTQGRDEQHDDAGDGGEASGLRRAGAGQHGFHRLASGLAQQAAELRREASARGVRAEEEAGDARHDQQKRAHREHGIIGKRGAQPGAPMVEPLVNCGLEDFQDHARVRSGGRQEELRRSRRVSAADAQLCLQH